MIYALFVEPKAPKSRCYTNPLIAEVDFRQRTPLMLARLCLALALAGAPSLALAQAAQQWPGVTIYGPNGAPLGTPGNPIVTTGNGGGSSQPASIARSAVVVSLPANTATQIASAGLKSFAAQVQGSNPVIVGYDNTVCTGTGITLAAANGTSPGQSSTEYPASSTAYWACSVAGSSVAVVRGQ